VRARPSALTVETAERVRARVARVRDGDSLVVSFPDGGDRDVRLHGIDAPEAGQPWGRESGEHLRRLALGREVDLHLRGIDGYGRHLAVAIVAEGDLGLLQLRGGHAWHYRRYADEQEPAVRERYAAAERAARAERLGLWASAAPAAPWDFKSDRRAGTRPPAEGATSLRAGIIVGNRRSRLYHLPGCPGHAAVAPGNLVLFESEAAARAAGFQRAGNC
jgi:micrococcal nuclease